MEAINDLTGFERFVQERSRGLWRAAWLLTGDSQHADDLVQTALAKTWGRYDSMENDNQFEAYVRTTIYRTFCSWWRRSSWRNEHPTEILPEQAHTAADQGINMDLRRALDELPRMQRSVIVMQYFEDLPLDQIAERLDIALGTAKAHASRAKAALRQSPHLASEATVPATDPTKLREGAQRKRRNAQAARVAVAVVALVALAVPLGMLWPGLRDPQIAEPTPTPSASPSESESPESSTPPTEDPQLALASDVRAAINPHESQPAPAACYGDDGQLLRATPGASAERGASRAWLCTDAEWYGEASPQDPLLQDVDRIVDLWEALPEFDGATGPECQAEGATPVQIVLEYDDGPRVIDIDEMNCGGTTDGTVQKGEADQFLQEVSKLLVEQRHYVADATPAAATPTCPASQYSLVGAIPGQATAAWACDQIQGEDKILDISDDLRERIAADIAENSVDAATMEEQLADGSSLQDIVLVDTYGNTLRLNRLVGGEGFHYLPPGEGRNSYKVWIPSTPELKAEADAIFG